MHLRQQTFRALMLICFWLGSDAANISENPPVFFQMQQAAAKGDLATLERILDGGTSLYETDLLGFTVACYAARAGNWNIVERLFARGYDPLALTEGRKDYHIKYQRGLEILPEAARQGRLDWVKRLINLGVDVDARNATSRQAEDPLCLALANKHFEIARLLLDSKCPINLSYILEQEYPKYGAFNPLHLAIWNRDLSIVQELVKLGADIDVPTNNGQSPLMLAVAYDWIEGVEFLLSAGASLENKDVDKRNVWTFAEHNVPIRLALVRKVLGVTKNQPVAPGIELILAIEADDMDTVSKLLQTPALADATDTNGVPVLIHASRAGRLESVRKLLEAKANSNKQSPDGDTAIYQAIVNKHESVARLLLEAGADPNIYAPTGWSPLERAIKLEEFEIAELLLEKGASPDSPVNTDGWRGPPICHAAQKGNLRIVSLLFEKGANIQAKDSDGIGALNYACESDNPAVLQFLATHGLDINRLAANRDAPLSIAVMMGNPATVRMALELGAKPVDLGPAISQMRVGSPKREEILALLKGKDAEAVAEDVFWNKKPSKLEIINYINSGGNPNYAGSKSPLFSALYSGDFELAQFLLEHGANPDLSGYVHGSPLWALVVGTNIGGEQRAVTVATQMLQLGANPNGNPKKESSSIFGAYPPLGLAVEQGRAGLVEVLLRFGADRESGRKAWEKYGGLLAPDLQVRIRKLLDKPWPKPVKF